jgi:hypothetical protein
VQQQEYKRQYLHLWSIFATIMEQMLCHCGALYLHTIMMQAFMSHHLQLKLTIGMLENLGAERSHQIGKVHFRKSLARWGRFYSGMEPNENRTGTSGSLG